MRGKDPMVTLTHSQHQPMGGAAEKPYWDCMAFVGPDRHGDYMPYTNPSKLRAGEGYEDGLEDAMRRGFEFFMRMQIRWETSQLRRGLPVP